MGKVTVLLWLVLAMCIGAPMAHGQDLWGYYPINQDDFKDYSGNGHDGTPTDGAAVVAERERGRSGAVLTASQWRIHNRWHPSPYWQWSDTYRRAFEGDGTSS